MAKQCPVCGEPKLYLDCLECEDRHQCDGTARNSNKEERKMDMRRKRTWGQGPNC